MDAVLWLALLLALSPAPSLRPSDDGAAGPRAPIVRADGGERPVADDTAAPHHEALRAARRGAEATLARATPAASLRSGTPAPALAAPTWPALASTPAGRALRRHGATVHARAARGGLLAYFPTAPPIPG